MRWKFLLALVLVAIFVAAFVWLWFGGVDCGDQGAYLYGGSLQCHHGMDLDGIA